MTETESQTKTTEETPKEEQESTTETPEITKLEASIIRQLEYYFGDANLARDKFLLEQISKDDGWVPMDVLLTFKRLKALSEDKKVIVDAIEKSTEGLIEISEDRDKLRRNPERVLPELNEATRKEIYGRTVYLKGFPAQDGTTMSELVDFFEPYEKVKNITMRKYHDKASKKYLFKGSVFVTFENKEQCAEFLKLDKLEYKGKELIRKMQDDYFEEKKADRKKRDKKKAEEKLDISHLPKGAIVHLDGLGKETSRESIKEKITTLGDEFEIAFIDYSKSDTSGHVRFAKADVGKKFLEKLTDGKVEIDGQDVTVKLLEGDVETEFLRKIVKDQQARRQAGNARNKNRKGGGGGGKGKHHHHHSDKKRKADDEGNGDEPSKKKQATEGNGDEPSKKEQATEGE